MGVARHLSPEFDIFQKAEPFIREIKKARMAPKRIMTDMAKVAEQSFEFFTDFPKDLLEISRALRKKNLSFTPGLKRPG